MTDASDDDLEFYEIEEVGTAVALGHNGEPEILPPGAPFPKDNRVRKYKPEFAEQAKDLYRFGATDSEVAEFFKVKRLSILRWRWKYPEFDAAVKMGKDHADDRVEASLYQRAVGYELRVEKLFAYQGTVTRAEVVEHVPADPKAAFFWIKNRRPEVWRDRHEFTGKDGTPLLPQDAASKTELARLAAFLLKQGAVASEDEESE